MDVSSETNSPNRVKKATFQLAFRMLTWLAVIVVGYALPATFGPISHRKIADDGQEQLSQAITPDRNVPESVAPSQGECPGDPKSSPVTPPAATPPKPLAAERSAAESSPKVPADKQPSVPARRTSQPPTATRASPSSVLAELAKAPEQRRAGPALPGTSAPPKAPLIVPTETPAYIPAFAIRQSIATVKARRSPRVEGSVASIPAAAGQNHQEQRVSLSIGQGHAVLASPADPFDSLPAYTIRCLVAEASQKSRSVQATSGPSRRSDNTVHAASTPVPASRAPAQVIAVKQPKQKPSGLAVLPESPDVRPARVIRRAIATAPQDRASSADQPGDAAEQKTEDSQAPNPTKEPPLTVPTAMLRSPGAENSDNLGPHAVELEQSARANTILPVAAVEQAEPAAKPQQTGQKSGETREKPESEGADAAITALEGRPITSLTVNIGHKAGATPKDIGREQLTRMQARTPDDVFGRNWPTVCYEWDAPALAHRPLYFEEVNLERYGYGMKYVRVAQPVISAGQFFATVPTLPYRMLAEPARDPVYTLGHYRPGSDVPYCPVYPPLSVSGGVAEAGVATGLIFLIP